MKEILVLAPRRYYMERVHEIISTLEPCKVVVISIQEKFSLNFKDQEYTFEHAPSLLSLFLFFFKKRKSLFDIFLVTNIDIPQVQLMLKLIRYKEFHTFDEGHVNTREDGKYYLKEFIYKGARRWWFLNKISGFPLPWGVLYDISDCHYTFYDPQKIKHPLRNHKNFKFIKRTNTSSAISSVFLGVNSFWGWTDDRKLAKDNNLYRKALCLAAERINSLEPSFYLMHPREDTSLVELLDSEVTVLKNLYGNEKFINSLFYLSGDLTVYTVMSGAIYDLDPLIKVRYVNIFNRFDQEHFDLWIKDINSFRKKLNKDSPKAFEIDFQDNKDS